MKVKRFNNLWAMGLILFGVILVAFYIAKIFFPQLIVGVAEIPSIVKFGNYVDSHLWAYIIFSFAISYIGGYFYYCACYRKYKLDLIENLFLIGFTIFSYVIQFLLPDIYTPYNYVVFVFQPFIVLFIKKNKDSKYLTSICTCFSVDIMAQAMSMTIRDIVMMSTQINIATITILLIDTWIWRILLYLFFNYKNKKES